MATKKNKTEKPSENSPPEPAGARRGADRSPSRRKALVVVGIGASAGGLQALQTFFDSLPADTGMAYVVITHLHPSHESHLAELLQPHTQMPVTQVNGKTPVHRDHVYVMPPNHRVILTDSHLDLKEFEEPRGRRVPIDQFFRSLAAAHRDAIAVILSGSGTDGSVGIKDIKADGGLLLVQSPEDAEYDGMPRAAISTGLADLILPARELAAKLVEYARQEPKLPSDPDKLTDKQHDVLDRILAQVHVRTGNDFTQYKRSTILRRILRRMQLNGFATLEDYLSFLRQNGGEAGAMFNDILIGVTSFFRDKPSWDALAEKAIPALFKHRAAGEPVRVWSVGCATGEEAYAAAMLLLEHASRLDTHYDMQVFASDLAEGALATAREGVYPAAIEADVSQERLGRFFIQEGNRYRVKRELRDMVLFTHHNLLRDPPFSRIDLLVCRNLLIYLQRGVQDILFDTFHYALNSGGYLFLGNSESAESVPDLFSPVDSTHRIYRSRPWRGEGPHIPALPLAMRRPRAREEPARSAGPATRNYAADAASLAAHHEAALEAYGPPSILVDENYNVLHVSETAGRFLLQPRGVLTRELLKLVRKELQPELQGTLFQAFERGRATLTKPVPVRFNGSTHRVVVAVQPRRSEEAEPQLPEKHALVVFLEDEFDEVVEAEETEREASGHEQDEMVSQLDGEVRRLREQLQAVVEQYNSSNEEMKAANEELQSINEEYRSTTEELETSREELQSVNEELQTVNNELKSHLDGISRANSDLENLMSASEIATLFLDRDLQIKRYTSGMDQVISILPSDRGRPVSHLANKLGYEELVKDSQEVLHELVSLEREVHSKDGKWFQVRLRPYRTLDHRIDGVVISFVDITQLKRAQEALEAVNQTLQGGVAERTKELDEANRQLLQANEMFTTLFSSNPVPTAINRLEDWEFLNVNDAYMDYFGVSREEIIGRSGLEFGFAPGVEQRARIRAELEETGLIRGLELEREWPPESGDVRTVLGSLQLIRVEAEQLVISSFIDITDRILAEREIRRLASELTVAEQEERHRISQVLHDELQQRLFAIRMQLSFLREAYEEGRPESFQADLPELEQWLGEAIATARNLSIELSPMILKEEGLPQAIEWLAAQMREKFGLDVDLNGREVQAPLSYSLRILLYRSIRELLFNVVKHSGTLKAKVGVEHADSRLRIVVQDRGAGFEPERVLSQANSSYGIGSIQSKLKFMGCTMKIDSAPGEGTRVTIEAPVEAAAG